MVLTIKCSVKLASGTWQNDTVSYEAVMRVSIKGDVKYHAVMLLAAEMMVAGRHFLVISFSFWYSE